MSSCASLASINQSFEPVARLAVGGMAELELVRVRGEAGFAKLCVLKRMLAAYSAEPEFLDMFLDEVRIASQLRHPHIIEIFETGAGDDGPWFTMEYVRGRDLREVLQAARAHGGMPLHHAITVVTAVASALEYAHGKCGSDGQPLEIVHRDVSPGNVLCGYDGAIKLCDFGVARANRRRSETKAGIIKGKIAYMSPEQVRGEKIDARSDVWSLGVVLYELTVGRRPIEADSEMLLLQRIALGKFPRPSSRKAYYPRALEQIVVRALASDPNDRYPSMDAMQADLEQLARRERMPLSTHALAKWVRGLFEIVPETTRAKAVVKAEAPAKPVRIASRLETSPWEDDRATTAFTRDEPAIETAQKRLPPRALHARFRLAVAAVALVAAAFAFSVLGGG